VANGAVPEIVLQFRLSQIQRAEKLAKEILKDVRKSTTLTKTAKKEQTAQIRHQIQRLRIVKKAELNRLREFQAGGQGIQALFGKAGRLREGAEQAGTVLGLRGSGSKLAAIGTLAGRSLPIIGIIVAAVEPLISAAMDALRQELMADMRLLTRRFELEVQRAQEAEPLADFTRKLAEDESFRRVVEQNSARASRAEDARGGWVGDDGLGGAF
jgi:hypothetical protein